MPSLQHEVATTLRDFYDFLKKLPWIEPEDVLEPPEQGWPNINTDNFRLLQKSSTVIEILRHLPYLRMDGPRGEYLFVYETLPCDYRRSYFQNISSNLSCWEIPETHERNFEFPAWVVPITSGKMTGQYLMLDTSDGTVMRYEAQWLHDPVFEDIDPRAWRNECDYPGSTARLKDILDEWREEYASLRMIMLPPAAGGPLIWVEGQGEEYEELRDLMLRYGWPNEFDREGCRDAMVQWRQMRLERKSR